MAISTSSWAARTTTSSTSRTRARRARRASPSRAGSYWARSLSPPFGARVRSDGRLDLKPGERIPDEHGAPIKLDGKGRETGRATLTVMDWDGDGKLDLIVSNAIESFDGLRWYRNIGTREKWVLARQPNLALNLPWNHYQLLDPIDWDGDGKTDLIAASEGGWLYFYKHR